MERSVPLLHHIVVEFPENLYTVNIRKSTNSVFEIVTLNPSWRVSTANLFRWFRNMQSSTNSENGTRNMLAMIEVFREHKDELFAALREYILLEGIVLASYHLQLEDSNLIGQLFHLMYECWSSFGPLHDKAILGRLSKKPSKNVPHVLRYFLEHARRNKSKFAGVRMVDVSIYSSVKKYPVFLAAEMWCWKELLIYLQYGARFEDNFQDPSTSFYRTPCPLIETLRHLIRHLWFRFVSTIEHTVLLHTLAQHYRELDPEGKNLCRTMNILLRALRRVSPGSLDFIIRECRGQNSVILVPSRDVIMHPSVQLLIPKLLKRYECPDELKHVCRWTIRKSLNENFQLPVGISALPLPIKLQRYLNLLID